MTIFFVVSGVLAWTMGALVGVIWYLGRSDARRLIQTPTLYPYLRFILEKSAGVILTWMSHLKMLPLGPITPSILEGLRSTNLKQIKKLRDAYRRLDNLPTIVKGKNALNLQSIFETIGKSVSHIPSPYTHPLQIPKYYLPGVPAEAFFDTAKLEWAGVLEDAYPVIKQELLDLLENEGRGFKGLVSQGGDIVTGWNTFNFFFFSKKYEENCALCPKTTAVLESLPLLEKEQIMFSALNPHVQVQPHIGPMNGIVRAHLPLIVPDGCGIKVGGIERNWTEGKVLAFDDSFLHEVWNWSDKVRIVLFLNFWHPCFSQPEIEVLREFRAAYEGAPLAQQFAKSMAKPRNHDLPAFTRDLKERIAKT